MRQKNDLASVSARTVLVGIQDVKLTAGRQQAFKIFRQISDETPTSESEWRASQMTSSKKQAIHIP